MATVLEALSTYVFTGFTMGGGAEGAGGAGAGAEDPTNPNFVRVHRERVDQFTLGADLMSAARIQAHVGTLTAHFEDSAFVLPSFGPLHLGRVVIGVADLVAHFANGTALVITRNEGDVVMAQLTPYALALGAPEAVVAGMFHRPTETPTPPPGTGTT
jgi:hypothetical protein